MPGQSRIRVAQLPTAGELRLLRILWDRGEATVEEVVNAHPPRSRPNYKTTQTLLRIMEDKGFITHKAQGRVFVFSPLVSRKTIDQRSVHVLLSQNFAGSASGLFLNLLGAAKVKESELDKIEAQIREYREKNGSGPRGRRSPVLPASAWSRGPPTKSSPRRLTRIEEG